MNESANCREHVWPISDAWGFREMWEQQRCQFSRAKGGFCGGPILDGWGFREMWERQRCQFPQAKVGFCGGPLNWMLFAFLFWSVLEVTCNLGMISWNWSSYLKSLLWHNIAFETHVVKTNFRLKNTFMNVWTRMDTGNARFCNQPPLGLVLLPAIMKGWSLLKFVSSECVSICTSVYLYPSAHNKTQKYFHVIFSTVHKLSSFVLSPGLLYVDTVILGVLLYVYIHTCNVL